MITQVWITSRFEAFHKYPDAPNEVKFLRNSHRHVFHVQLSVYTEKSREVEFFLLRKDLDRIVRPLNKQNLDSLSCEGIAVLIATKLAFKYSLASITVSEDGENGATLSWPKE